jgi:hypothetical protein
MTDTTFVDSYIATDAATQYSEDVMRGYPNGSLTKRDYENLLSMPEVQPGLEAVEFYLEAAQAAVLQLAQDLEAQEAGFQ